MNDQPLWFAARVPYPSTKRVKARLEELAVEAFIPFRKTKVERDGQKVSVERPLVPGLILLHTTREVALDLVSSYGLPLSFMYDAMTHHWLVIRDKAMQDFIFLTDFSEDAVEVLTESLRPGDRVRVAKGPFEGVEGELIRLKGHKRVVVRLEGLFSLATTYIPGAFLEKIEA